MDRKLAILLASATMLGVAGSAGAQSNQGAPPMGQSPDAMGQEVPTPPLPGQSPSLGAPVVTDEEQQEIDRQIMTGIQQPAGEDAPDADMPAMTPPPASPVEPAAGMADVGPIENAEVATNLLNEISAQGFVEYRRFERVGDGYVIEAMHPERGWVTLQVMPDTGDIRIIE